MPPVYREFLLQVGPGAGPYYGIWAPEEIEAETEGDPAKPFPFTRRDAEQIYNAWYAWVRDPKPNSGGGPSIQAPDPTPGCIFIGTQGCSGVTALVTAGELTGTVWDVWLDESAWRPAKTAPASLESELNDLTTPIYLGPTPTFDAWYEAWLTRADAELSPPGRTS